MNTPTIGQPEPRLSLTLEEMIAAVPRLPDTRRSLRVESEIAKERLEKEMARHREMLRIIREQFEVECWREVEANWSAEEIEAAGARDI